jgi:hypothetical protein
MQILDKLLVTLRERPQRHTLDFVATVVAIGIAALCGYLLMAYQK